MAAFAIYKYDFAPLRPKGPAAGGPEALPAPEAELFARLLAGGGSGRREGHIAACELPTSLARGPAGVVVDTRPDRRLIAIERGSYAPGEAEAIGRVRELLDGGLGVRIAPVAELAFWDAVGRIRRRAPASGPPIDLRIRLADAEPEAPDSALTYLLMDCSAAARRPEDGRRRSPANDLTRLAELMFSRPYTLVAGLAALRLVCPPGGEATLIEIDDGLIDAFIGEGGDRGAAPSSHAAKLLECFDYMNLLFAEYESPMEHKRKKRHRL